MGERGAAPRSTSSSTSTTSARAAASTATRHDYADNAERFAFLSRAALALPAALGSRPRIVHVNDWQTGLVPFLLRHEHARDPALAGARTVFTIHNLAYQGIFPKHVVPALGLPWDVFRYEAMEFHDQLNFLKAGLVFADALTTVSPTYAREITTPEGGAGLDALLRQRARDLHGILNGIDVDGVGPRDRPPPAGALLRRRPRREGARARRRCSASSGCRSGRTCRSSRWSGASPIRRGSTSSSRRSATSLGRDLQLALLGSGRRDWEEAFRRAARERPDRMAARIGFDEGLAHRIEAGADLFLMPSRFEPCGLNQMYSLRYGTVPVVRAVGGLDDTVEDFDGLSRGTGFKFRDYTPAAR